MQDGTVGWEARKERDWRWQRKEGWEEKNELFLIALNHEYRPVGVLSATRTVVKMVVPVSVKPIYDSQLN